MSRPRYPSCIFCRQTDAPPSKEDVFAKWIAREWPDGAKSQFVIEGGRTGQEFDEKWGAKGNMGIVVTKPCERCNNGWMSRLEGRAIPILKPLLWGRATSLQIEDQLVIARWMVKTTMMYEFFRRRSPRFFQPKQRLEFFKHQSIPSRTMIWIGHYVGGRDAWFIDTSDIPLDLSVEGSTVRGYAYSATFTIGQLALQIFAHRWPENLPVKTVNFKVPGNWRTATHQVWPQGLIDRTWPPELSLDNVSVETLANRWATLLS